MAAGGGWRVRLFDRRMAVGGGVCVRLFDRRMAVGGGGRVRRPPRPLRPARCRCRVRGGAGRGCGRPARGERAAKTRRNLPAFLRKDFFAFLLHFAACRAETLLRDDDRPMRGLMVDRYGERRALTSRFLSPEPLSCMVGAQDRDVRAPVSFCYLSNQTLVAEIAPTVSAVGSFHLNSGRL